MSLANKYRPQNFTDVIGQENVVSIVSKMCPGGELSNRNFLFTGPAGTGKAQPLYSKVLTPNGFITMGEVTVGQKVITGSGAVAEVSGVYPQGVRPIYEIQLTDKHETKKVRVADCHLNVVKIENQRQIITTDLLVRLWGEGYEIQLPIYDDNHEEFIYMSDFEYVGKEECQCIMINHPDHTYVSDDFIVTHNTTLGRILAKELNGTIDNLIEIDAASHSSVDDIRELIQQASQYPIGTKYKILLIDEVHSLSNSAFQALLKVLEEQVAMTVWILATTNPEKIPATILSRVQTFKLSKLSSDLIYSRLKWVIAQENSEGQSITYTEDAIKFLANYANGGMRDALTNLDKVLAFGNDITSELLEKALDLPNYDDYFELLNGIVKRDNALITNIIDRTYNSGVNFVKWFEGYHSFLCNIVKYIFLKDINKTNIPGHYLHKIQGYGSQHAALCLKLSNRIMQMNKDLKQTQYLQEVCMSYLLTPETAKKQTGGDN